MPKFTVEDLEGTLHHIKDFELDSKGQPTEIACNYLVGWTLIPPWIMGGGLANVCPVNSLDGAGQRGRGSGASHAPSIIRGTAAATPPHPKH